MSKIVEGENSCRITYIYGLYEVGKENEIRYVGKSDNIYKRLKDHRNDKANNHKTCWIKSILNKNSSINIKVLKICDSNNWKEVEIKTISEYNNLTNSNIGGDGGKIKYNKDYNYCVNWIRKNKPDYVHSNKNYKIWSKSESFPDFLPIAPNKVFNEWINWGDYLSTGRVHSKYKIFLNYENAKKYLKDNFNIKSSLQYRNTKLPSNIPKKPFNYYKEWTSWSDFLDYKPYKRDKDIKYLSYEESKNWILNNYGKITVKIFREYCKNNTLPIFIPKKPDRLYDNFNWIYFLSKK